MTEHFYHVLIFTRYDSRVVRQRITNIRVSSRAIELKTEGPDIVSKTVSGWASSFRPIVRGSVIVWAHRQAIP